MCFSLFSLPQTPSFFLGTTTLHIFLPALFLPFRCFWWKVKAMCSCWENVMRNMGIDFFFIIIIYTVQFLYVYRLLSMTWEMELKKKKKKVLRNFLFFETKLRQDIPGRGHKIFSFFLEWCRGGGQEPISFLFFVQNFLIYFIGHSDVLMRLDSASFLSYRWPCSAITGQSLHF